MRQARARTHLAAALVDPEPALHVQMRDALARGADLIELRADRIGDDAAVAELLQAPRTHPLILTVRAAAEGGAWDGDDADRVALIERLGLLQPGYVDVEHALWRRSANVRQKIGLVCRRAADAADAADARVRNRLILSYHDLNDTPAGLDSLFAELAGAEPDAVIKLVTTADDATDALRVLELLARHAAERDIIALAMGEAGLVARVLAQKFGAFLSFAATADARTSAPGQVTLELMRERYRWDAIGSKTKLYGVIGWPVSHSRSPELHNAALAAAGIDGVYVPLPVRPTSAAFARFMDFVTDAAWLDAAGFSVTIPHKEHALRWLRARGFTCDALAARCGAVNTLTRTTSGGWHGENTDAPGAIRALLAGGAVAEADLAGMAADVLGAGGAARAIVAALRERGCRVTIWNRSAARAADLADEFGCAVGDWDTRAQLRGPLVVNCTSVGMTPDIAAAPLPAGALRSYFIVMDTIYTPRETQLLRDARDQGARTIDGVAMFLAQAALQFECWRGQPAPPGAFAALSDT